MSCMDEYFIALYYYIPWYMQNVVVLNQPAAPQMTTEVTIHSRPNDYLVLTIVMMVLCGLHLNLLAFLFLIPALCFAFAVSTLIYLFRQSYIHTH